MFLHFDHNVDNKRNYILTFNVITFNILFQPHWKVNQIEIHILQSQISKKIQSEKPKQ